VNPRGGIPHRTKVTMTVGLLYLMIAALLVVSLGLLEAAAR
jgi:hypothetical protein